MTTFTTVRRDKLASNPKIVSKCTWRIALEGLRQGHRKQSHKILWNLNIWFVEMPAKIQTHGYTKIYTDIVNTIRCTLMGTKQKCHNSHPLMVSLYFYKKVFLAILQLKLPGYASEWNRQHIQEVMGGMDSSTRERNNLWLLYTTFKQCKKSPSQVNPL